MSTYWSSYLYVVLFLLLGIALPVGALYLLGPLLRPNKPSTEKLSTYESGIEPVGEAQTRYNVRYYLFALLFVVFDVETLFLFPWAVSFEKLGMFGVVEVFVFIFFLLIGLLYAWNKKVLEWK